MSSRDLDGRIVGAVEVTEPPVCSISSVSGSAAPTAPAAPTGPRPCCWEADEFHTASVWRYPDLSDPAYALGRTREPLRNELTAHLLELGAVRAQQVREAA